MCTRVRAQTLQHERQGKTIAQLSIKPAMLVSSVQAVVTCYVTALRVCTLVLFISVVFGTAIPTSLYIFGKCFSYLLAYSFLHNSILKEDVVLASFF